MDDDQLGEFAYDYVEVRRDYLAWTPAKDEPEKTESNVNPSDRHGIPEHSDMIQGQSPDHSSQDGGHAHTGIQGDRHGIAAENVEKEKAGMLNGHQNGALAPSS
jgi:Amt family ammonium transporter